MEGIIYGEVSASRGSRSYAFDGRSRRPQSRRQGCVHVGLCGLLQRPESGDGRAKVVHEISSPHAEPDMHPRTGLFERSHQRGDPTIQARDAQRVRRARQRLRV